MEKVMIVDDSFTSRMYIRKCINMALGNELSIVEAKDGQDALQKLRNETVELIISDVNMPIMCGFTLMRNLKETPCFKQIPVIFITSLANDGRTENLMDLGAFEVLKKPLSPALLVKALNKLQQPVEPSSAQGWGD